MVFDYDDIFIVHYRMQIKDLLKFKQLISKMIECIF